jgi:hypothetical protein
MKSAWLAFVILAGVLVQPASAAQAPSREAQETALSQCVVMRTNGADRTLTAQWIFSAMARSPHIANLAAVPDQKRIEIDQAFAQLLTRLVIKDCLAEVRPLASANIQDAFERVGGALGEVAMQELMGDPSVNKAIANYTDYLSEKDFKPLIDHLDKVQSK